jgi:hypothetical protein
LALSIGRGLAIPLQARNEVLFQEGREFLRDHASTSTSASLNLRTFAFYVLLSAMLCQVNQSLAAAVAFCIRNAEQRVSFLFLDFDFSGGASLKRMRKEKFCFAHSFTFYLPQHRARILTPNSAVHNA